jgi:glycosyltransferase involved in cell wall biosynthesis
MAARPLIHILFEIKDGPWGGGNQFLKALRSFFISKSIYSDTAEAASVVLFNSHHHLEAVADLKRRHPEKVFLHRCDGPIFVVRGSGWEVDRTIFRHNERIADGSIFQSQWSRDRAKQEGMRSNRFETVIHNAPDSALFHPAPRPSRDPGGKVRLLAMSWSTNPKKGFDAYAHLDEHLDMERYSMTFIGKTPEPFRRIRVIPPLNSLEVADAMRAHDIFISASHLEACSNAIVEALNCGIPALVRNNSSQPELVRDPRLVFKDRFDLIPTLDRVAAELDDIRRGLRPETMEEVGSRYAEFASEVFSKVAGPGGPGPKRLSAPALARMRLGNGFDRLRARIGFHRGATAALP